MLYEDVYLFYNLEQCIFQQYADWEQQTANQVWGMSLFRCCWPSLSILYYQILLSPSLHYSKHFLYSWYWFETICHRDVELELPKSILSFLRSVLGVSSIWIFSFLDALKESWTTQWRQEQRTLQNSKY